MTDRSDIGFPNSRKYNRLAWDRPVEIITPIKATAQAINVSATGILLVFTEKPDLEAGVDIQMEIPHASLTQKITVNGKVLRVERVKSFYRVAIQLA
ncbi:MAG: PilZ domain-containing protein [Anaerolineaceae bacterium]